MSKELSPLEALERYGYHCNHYVNGKKDYQIIETALERLEQLEEENKSLRANIENLDETYFETWRVCEELKKNSNYALMFIDNTYCLVDTKDNKFEVIDNYEINNKGIIENKKVKALEIIKEKNVDVEWLMRSETLIQYNGCIGNRHKEIEQEEFDLFKEVLGD